MKIGNTSQSIVPVPNFFLNRTTRDLDTFHVPRRKFLFREKDLYKCTKDININNNPRNHNRRLDDLNRTKYHPIYHKRNTSFDDKLNGEQAGSTGYSSLYAQTIPSREKKIEVEKSEYEKYQEYMNKTNFMRHDLRDEIKSDVKNLIERININIDIPKWSKFDSKVTFNDFYNHTTSFSPLTTFIGSTESDNLRFKQTLFHKVNSMKSISPKRKEKILKDTFPSFPKKNGGKNLDNLIITSNSSINTFNDNNNREKYNQTDQKLIEQNMHIYEAFNKTNLFKGFPSPFRTEFASKFSRPIKNIHKIQENLGLVKKTDYNYKESDLYNCTHQLWSRPLHKDHFK